MNSFDRNLNFAQIKRQMGPGGNPWVFLFCISVFVLFGQVATAKSEVAGAVKTENSSLAEKNKSVAESQSVRGDAESRGNETEPRGNEKSWTNFLPYSPEKNEYGAEIGGMWEERNFYYLGGSFGKHIGRCFMWTDSSCQQYVDFIGGAASREAYTIGVAMVGLRWQFISFPKPFSPSFRLLGGVFNFRDDHRDRSVGSFGLGVGFTATINPKLDIKWENRVGYADQFWGQSVVSFSLKIDHWVDDFSDKMKTISGATLDAATFVPRTFFDWFKVKKSTPTQSSNLPASQTSSDSPNGGSAGDSNSSNATSDSQ
jgi:hypothetical protein